MKRRLAAMSRTDLVMLVLAILYIVSPIDVIPELVTGPLGLTDDVAAFGLVVALLLRSRPASRDGLPEA